MRSTQVEEKEWRKVLDLRIRKISSKRTGCMNDAGNTTLSFLLFLLKDFASTKTYGIGA